jgi:hypothetical protein
MPKKAPGEVTVFVKADFVKGMQAVAAAAAEGGQAPTLCNDSVCEAVNLEFCRTQ